MTLLVRLCKNPVKCVHLIIMLGAVSLLFSFMSYRKIRRQLGFASPVFMMQLERQNESEQVAEETAEPEPTFEPVNRSKAHLQSVCNAPKPPKERVVRKKKIRPTPQKPRHKKIIARRKVASAERPPSGYEARFSLPLYRSQFYVSSPFGPRRLGGVRRFHTGIDMAAVRGTPVRAAGKGVVIFAGWAGGYGNCVIIEHDSHCRTRYAHMSKIKTQSGAQVSEGEVIGLVGATGHVRKRRGGDGSHLHFEVEVDGRARNPLYFFK